MVWTSRALASPGQALVRLREKEAGYDVFDLGSRLDFGVLKKCVVQGPRLITVDILDYRFDLIRARAVAFDTFGLLLAPVANICFAESLSTAT